MSERYGKYRAVIGLEVHAQLITKSKAFSADPNMYGDSPNTNVSVISLGHPGTLPRPNLEALKLAVRMGIATNSTINKSSFFSRKNYFYADLPKGYQITQFVTPVCTDGTVKIKSHDGSEKNIHIQKIILEEDSGKSIHDLDPFSSLVDLNRAGVPLIEIVTGPDMSHPEEAYNYLTEIRKLVRYLDICDGNMEEGSLRCDANISVMKADATEFGTKVEVKNLNSIRNVQRAIAHEIERQIQVIENGGVITHDTRGFDAASGTTASMRSKELANDYRYFPEPDLPPVVLSDEFIHTVKEEMPELPEVLHLKLVQEYGLNEYDAAVIIADKQFAFYFLEVVQRTDKYKTASNIMNGPLRSYLNENGIEIADLILTPDKIAELSGLIESNKLSFSSAAQRLFPEMIRQPGKPVVQIAAELNLMQDADESLIQNLVREALAKFPEKVQEYRSGKKNLLGLFMGEIMKASRGKADPKMANKILINELEK